MAAESVSVPVPVFVMPAVPLITPLPVMFPAPAKVAAKFPVIAPERVKVPAVDPIVVAAARVMAPPQVLLPLTLSRAPVLLWPVPLRVSASAPAVMPPWI